ncbi:hypothetical protein BJ508DRAFT_316391 [Ascobolus immersus RN42]|uniref:Uncharacterized protein n=1 Tax=Ascobolus immersus RN42 TaxID=1160509 RepID=A0A3N4HDK4_ASCIM|nr:hypothetical protein BJ508DRAFT_316391 [Ascobolus immersus RN42]
MDALVKVGMANYGQNRAGPLGSLKRLPPLSPAADNAGDDGDSDSDEDFELNLSIASDAARRAQEKLKLAMDYVVLSEVTHACVEILHSFMNKHGRLVSKDVQHYISDLLMALITSEFEDPDEQVFRARDIAAAFNEAIGDEPSFISIESELGKAIRPISTLVTSADLPRQEHRGGDHELASKSNTTQKLVPLHRDFESIQKEIAYQSRFDGLPIIRQKGPLRRRAKMEGDIEVEKDNRFSSSDSPFQPLPSSPPETSRANRRRQNLAMEFELLYGARRPSASRQLRKTDDFERDVAEEAGLAPETIEDSLGQDVDDELTSCEDEDTCME